MKLGLERAKTELAAFATECEGEYTLRGGEPSVTFRESWCSITVSRGGHAYEAHRFGHDDWSGLVCRQTAEGKTPLEAVAGLGPEPRPDDSEEHVREVIWDRTEVYPVFEGGRVYFWPKVVHGETVPNARYTERQGWTVRR